MLSTGCSIRGKTGGGQRIPAHFVSKKKEGNTDSVRREIGEKKLFFAEFYKTFLKIGKRELESRWSGLGEEVEEMLYEAFEDVLAIRLQNIALRTLIAELHSYKQKGNLSGETSEQEYESFCKICGSREFFGHISRWVARLLIQMSERMYRKDDLLYYEQVMRSVIEDRESLSCLFGKERGFGEYCKGRVRPVRFPSRRERGVGYLFCKRKSDPARYHVLWKTEQFYQKLLDWIGERTGTDQDPSSDFVRQRS